MALQTAILLICILLLACALMGIWATKHRDEYADNLLGVRQRLETIRQQVEKLANLDRLPMYETKGQDNRFAYVPKDELRAPPRKGEAIMPKAKPRNRKPAAKRERKG